MPEIPRDQAPDPEDLNFEMLRVELDSLKERIDAQDEKIAAQDALIAKLEADKVAAIAENNRLKKELKEFRASQGIDQDKEEPDEEDFEVIVHDKEESEEEDFDIKVRPRQAQPPRQAARQEAAKPKKNIRNRAMGALAVAGAVGLLAGGAFAGLFSSGDKEVKANSTPQDVAASVANTPERQKMLADSAAAPTVSEAVLKMHSTPSTIKANIVEIFNQKQRHTLDHRKGAMCSMASEFAPAKIDALNAAETVAFCAVSSDSYATGHYNQLHGRRVTDGLPEGVSVQDARNYIEGVMIAQGTKFSIQNPVHKVFRNHGMRGEHRFYANTIKAEGQISMFVITDDHGKSYYIKTQDECFNLLNELKGAGHVNPQASQIVVPGPHVGPTPTSHPRPKHDNNTTPAGVPGEPRGSGGNGQEPTRPHAGKAPSSVHQPQQPTPPRVSTHGETRSTKPAETGVDHGTTGPATRGNGTQSPAGTINEGTTPSGD